MIFNYALTHYCCEKTIFVEKVYHNLLDLLKKVRDENIILIMDKNDVLMNHLKEGLKSCFNNSDHEYLHFIETLIDLEDKRKIYKHDFEYDENNVQKFLNSITDCGIFLDAVIVDNEEESSFKKTIPIEKFSLEHPNDKKREIVNKKGINLIDYNIKELDKIYQRIVWDSPVFKYYDYNLGNGTFKPGEILNLAHEKTNNKDREIYKWKISDDEISKNQLRQIHKWKIAFESLSQAIKSVNKKIIQENKILVEIFTPQPLKKYKNLSHKELINSLKKNKLMLQLLEEKICNEIRDDNIDFKIYFYDSLLGGETKFGGSEHNRLFFSLSSRQIDVAKGLDIYDLKTRAIQQGKWRFIGSKEDTMKDIIDRNPLDINKYKEKIEFLENSTLTLES